MHQRGFATHRCYQRANTVAVHLVRREVGHGDLNILFTFHRVIREADFTRLVLSLWHYPWVYINVWHVSIRLCYIPAAVSRPRFLLRYAEAYSGLVLGLSSPTVVEAAIRPTRVQKNYHK